jgi:hypothetical protein
MNPEDLYQGDKDVCMSCDKAKDKIHTKEEVRLADGKCRNGHVIFLRLGHLRKRRYFR